MRTARPAGPLPQLVNRALRFPEMMVERSRPPEVNFYVAILQKPLISRKRI